MDLLQSCEEAGRLGGSNDVGPEAWCLGRPTDPSPRPPLRAHGFPAGVLFMAWWEGRGRECDVLLPLALSRTVGSTCWPIRRAVTGTGSTMTAAP